MNGAIRSPARPDLAQTVEWRGTQEEFLVALQNRDRVAMGVLFDRFEPMVNRLVWRFLGADTDHDDVVRNVFLRALESVPMVRSAQSLEGWMTSLTVNTVRTELRRRRFRRWLRLESAADRDDGVAPDEPEHRDDFEARDALKRTYQVLAALPAEEQIAFVLRHLDGQSLEEAAAGCSCSLATIKRRLSRAEERFGCLASRDPVLAERLASGRRWGQS